MMHRFVPILLIATWAAVPCAASAAEFVLVNGGRIEGELLNPDQSPRQTYLVAVTRGAKITLTNDQVAKVVDRSDELKWYDQWLPKMPPTVDGHWTMAEECRKRGLTEQRQKHLQWILEMDPQHEGARYGLGYSRVNGNWVRMDEWMTQQGYIRYRGSWRLPHDVAIEKAAEERDRRVKDWKRKIKTWRTWVEKRRGKETDALENIKRIRDVDAAEALADVVKDEQAHADFRLICIHVLGELKSAAGVAAFVDRAINDPNANVRDACLDELTRHGAPVAVAAFTKLLTSPDNKKVNRAAVGLGRLKDPAPTLDLIEALVTEHKFLLKSGGAPGQLNLGFGSGPGSGGNGFSAGNSTKLIKRSLQNQGVLNALLQIHPGINFAYDEQRWKDWYIDENTPVAVNLRRRD